MKNSPDLVSGDLGKQFKTVFKNEKVMGWW